MKCQKCGTENSNNSKFCKNCGANIQTQKFVPPPINNQTYMVNVPRKKSKTKIILIVIAIVLVLFLFRFMTVQPDNKDNASSTSSSITSIPDSKSPNSQNEQLQVEDSSKIKSDSSSKKEEVKVSKEDFIASCIEVPYNDLAREPNKFKGKNIKVTIQISQVLEGGLFTESGYHGYEDYELNLDDDKATYLKKEWYISYELDDGEPKILEDDVVTFYGTFNGDEELTRITGAKESVPNLIAKYHIINSEQ